MLAAIREVTHPDGLTISSYKYLPTPAHITLMAFIMKHVKVNDNNLFINKQNKMINSNIAILKRFIPSVSNGELIELLEDFCNRTLTTKQLDRDGEIDNLESTTFISAYTYNRNTRQVDIELSYRLIPFILYIKQQYIGERWKYSASFTSSYSTLLYDIILTSLDKHTSGIKFTLEQIKDMLGIEPKTYQIYSNFKRKVLNVAISEINLRSDMAIELIEHKENRKVTDIEFMFKKSNNTQ